MQTLQYEIPASETCQQHIFQQKHKMLKPDNSNYYEYAIGGKTGYTSDALSTLITMADNGNMKLVCVVLRTHGKNIYPDTTNLFNYAFDNFEKIELKGQETSEDISEILEDESRENCGYVVVLKGVELSDLDMEMKVDKKEHSPDIKKQEKASDNETDKSGKKSLRQMLVNVFIIILLLLILLFIVRLVQYRKKLKRKRRRSKGQKKRRQDQQGQRRKKKKMLDESRKFLL